MNENWFKQIQNNGTLQIDENQLFFQSIPGLSGQCVARWKELVPVPDFKINYQLKWFDSNDIINENNLFWETRFRWNLGTNNYYAVRFNYLQNTITVLRVLNNSNISILWTTYFGNWNVSFHDVEIFMRGNTIDVNVDGINVIGNVNDNFITDAGYVGIGVRGLQTPAPIAFLPINIFQTGSGNNVLNANGLATINDSATTFNCFAPGSKKIRAQFNTSSVSFSPTDNLYFFANFIKSKKSLASPDISINYLTLDANGYESVNKGVGNLTTSASNYEFSGSNDLYWGLPEIITGLDLALNPNVFIDFGYSVGNNTVEQDAIQLKVGVANGVRWDNFSISFLQDQQLIVSGYYIPGIMIPSTGSIRVSGFGHIRHQVTGTGGVSLKGIGRIRRHQIASGGVSVTGNGLESKLYLSIGTLNVNGYAVTGRFPKPLGGIKLLGSAFFSRGWRGQTGREATLEGEAEIRTTGIKDYYWKDYTRNGPKLSGDAPSRISRRGYYYNAVPGTINISSNTRIGRSHRVLSLGNDITVTGEYVYKNIQFKQNPIGSIITTGFAENVKKTIYTTGLIFVSGRAITSKRNRIYLASDEKIKVTGSALCANSYWKYTPDLSLDIISSLDGSKIKPNPVSSFAYGIFKGNLKDNILNFNLELSFPESTPTGMKLYIGNDETELLFLDITELAQGFVSPIVGSLNLNIPAITGLRFGSFAMVIESDIYPDGEIKGQLQPISPLIVSSQNYGAITKYSPRKYSGTGEVSVSGSIPPTSVKTNRFVYKGSKQIQCINPLSGDNIYPPINSNYAGEVNLTLDKKIFDFYICNLTNAQALPPTNSSARGIALINYDKETRDISWTIALTEINSNILSATLHAPALPGQNGPLAINLLPHSNGNISPIIGTYKITDNEYNKLLLGTYLLIKTVNYPEGEIRGQLAFQTTGPSGNLTIIHNIPVEKIKNINFHAPTNDEMFAPIAINLQSFFISTESPIQFIKMPINRNIISHIAKGQSYIQIATKENPDGELRCNLTPTSGSLILSGNARVNKILGYVKIAVRGSAVIGRSYKPNANINVHGTFERAYKHEIDISRPWIFIEGSGITRSYIFANGGIVIGGASEKPILILNHNVDGGIKIEDSAIVSKVINATGAIFVNGTINIKYQTWNYVPSGQINVDSKNLIKSTRKYLVSGGCTVSGVSICKTKINTIFGKGGINVEPIAFYVKNHHQFKMTGSIQLGGNLIITNISRKYIGNNKVLVSGKAVTYKIRFLSSTLSPKATSRLMKGIIHKEKEIIVNQDSVSKFCEYNLQNQNEKECPNGAWVPIHLRKTQKDYMPPAELIEN